MRKRERVSVEERTGKWGRENRLLRKREQMIEEEKTCE